MTDVATLTAFKRATELNAAGVWNRWLSSEESERFQPCLSSPSEWDKFIKPSKVDAQQAPDVARLQLRVRTILFDPSLATFGSCGTERTLHSTVVPEVLRFDDVYYSLEYDAEDWELHTENNVISEPLRNQLGLRPPGALRSDGQKATEGGTRSAGTSSALSRNRSRSNRELSALLPDVKPSASRRVAIPEEVQIFWSEAEKVLEALKNMGSISEPFLMRVSKTLAPNYYDVIKFPMDLEKMTKKLKSGKYLARQEFQDDIDLIVKNCRYFNEPNSSYVKKLLGKWRAATIKERLVRVARLQEQRQLPFKDRSGLQGTPAGMRRFLDQAAAAARSTAADASSTSAGPVGADTQRDLFWPEGDGFNCGVPLLPMEQRRRRSQMALPAPGTSDGSSGRGGGRGGGWGATEKPAESTAHQRMGKRHVDHSSELGEDTVRRVMRKALLQKLSSMGFQGAQESAMDIFVEIAALRMQHACRALRTMMDTHGRSTTLPKLLQACVGEGAPLVDGGNGTPFHALRDEMAGGLIRQEAAAKRAARRREEAKMLMTPPPTPKATRSRSGASGAGIANANANAKSRSSPVPGAGLPEVPLDLAMSINLRGVSELFSGAEGDDDLDILGNGVDDLFGGFEEHEAGAEGKADAGNASAGMPLDFFPFLVPGLDDNLSGGDGTTTPPSSNKHSPGGLGPMDIQIPSPIPIQGLSSGDLSFPMDLSSLTAQLGNDGAGGTSAEPIATKKKAKGIKRSRT
ncbi:hypothetical protein CYMTET_9572 [Cymbomonas tetramitiformis]|uniref:Bromo domain-containing protein n=1 Tax=Cymbomonas tetramitiformis TaxID=36881 RepID=A0AAE0GQQ8_9CHLO|nr:hypothetical protein CYMTET_9572 [Cymbomonas tetramitiformis]